MKKRVFAWLAGACALAITGAAHADPFKVGLITPSPIADVGWAKQLDLGREAMAKECGENVEAKVVDNVSEGPDAARVMNQLMTDGAEFIVLGSFGYMNDGLRAARRHPNVDFIHASGFKQTENFGTFTARNYEGFYLGGLAAGMVTKSDTIGMVAAFAVPEVVAEANAITLAIHEVNPQAEVKIVWLNSWFDPPKAQEAARALVSQGADVLFSLHQDTPSVVNVAEAEGVYVVNTSSDMSSYGPNSVLASVTNDWSSYFVRECKAAREGTFEGSDFRGGLASGTVKVAAWNEDLTDEQMAVIKKAEKDIKNGSIHVFDGPIKDQDGKVRAEAGSSVPDPEIFGMNWLVEGLSGSIPK